VPLLIAAGTACLLLLGAVLFWRAQAQVNRVALVATPKGVTVLAARSTSYRPSRRYVGTLEPWVEAKVGPQFVSAYVDTVLVRPGASVKRGEVLATLDCRNAAATSKAVEMQARALETMQAAIKNQAERIAELGHGGFVSPNEIEQKTAESASKQAQVLAMQAQMLGSALQVGDCILRAPFDGDVAERFVDPGAFVRPGMPIVSVVDRSLIRLTADVPEQDFVAVAPGSMARVHILSTGDDLSQPITRRSPAVDPATRTAHIEVDLPDPERRFAVFTTAEITVDVGQSAPALELPLSAVTLRGARATTFVVREGKATKVTVTALGEALGKVFLDPTLGAGTLVVVEGRAALNDGDLVTTRELPVAESLPHGQTAALDSKTPSPQ
jgi:RND family efflux transporter MFP subunit